MPTSLIEEIVGAARSSHPQLTTPTDSLREVLAARFLSQPDPQGTLRGVLAHAGDLYLAIACAAGEPQAVRIFDAEIVAQTPRLVARARLTAEQLNELTQRLRLHVLVPQPGHAARLATYSGRGRLLDWYRVLALREAVLLARQESPARTGNLEGAIEAALRQQGEAATQERAHVWHRYADAYRDALRQAICALSAADRNLLRWHFVDGLNGSQLGALLKRNRSTVHRRLLALLEQIHADVIRGLQQTLDCPQSELESLLRALRSQLDLSLSDLLSEPMIR